VSLAVVVAAYLLVRWWPRVLVLAAGFVLPVLVGLSRLELGVHWPTDVVAGLALGTCAALATVGVAAWFAGAEPLAGAARRPVVARTRGLLLTRRGVNVRIAA
jgi:undecaprenyl-diphosphatase